MSTPREPPTTLLLLLLLLLPLLRPSRRPCASRLLFPEEISALTPSAPRVCLPAARSVRRTGMNINYSLAFLAQEENQLLACPPHLARNLSP